MDFMNVSLIDRVYLVGWGGGVANSEPHPKLTHVDSCLKWTWDPKGYFGLVYISKTHNFTVWSHWMLRCVEILFQLSIRTPPPHPHLENSRCCNNNKHAQVFLNTTISKMIS